MAATLDDANAALRSAVRERLDNTPKDDPKMQGYKRESCCDGGKFYGHTGDRGQTPMAASLAGCQPAMEAAVRCFDTTSTDAVKDDSTAAQTPSVPVNWILEGDKELREQRLSGDGVLNSNENYAEWQPTAFRDRELRPGSDKFLAVLNELRDLHMRKTLDYGVDDDALSNIRNSADIVNMPAWSGCILRISDKMHRLKAFFRRGRVEFDGIEDTLKDICAYSAIALVLYREGQTPCREQHGTS